MIIKELIELFDDWNIPIKVNKNPKNIIKTQDHLGIEP